MALRQSIEENDVDSFQFHLDELESVLKNQRMKKLLEKDGTLCYAAHVGSNPIIEALIEKGIGKGYMYCIVGDTISLLQIL